MVMEKKEEQKQAKISEEQQKKEEGKTYKKALERCLKEKEEYLNGWKRAKADFINYKKEESERIKDFMDMAKIDLILKLLPILDNLERAEKYISKEDENNKVIKGFIQIKKQIEDFLKRENVEEIKVLGEEFNPATTEVVGEINDPSKKSGIVAEVVQKGYKFKNRIIRPAKAKVVNN